MTALIIIYLVLCAADIFITLKGRDVVGVRESNPLMFLLLVKPWAFIVAQVVINGAAIVAMLICGIGLAIIAIVVKGAVVANNAMVYMRAQEQAAV